MLTIAEYNFFICRFLPNYRSPVLQRNFLSIAAPYMRLQTIIQKSFENKNNLAAAMTAYLDEKRTIFDRVYKYIQINI